MLKPCTNGKPLNDCEPCDFDRMDAHRSESNSSSSWSLVSNSHPHKYKRTRGAPPTNLQPQQYPSTTNPKTITPIFAHEGSGTKTLNTKHPLFASQILDLGCRSPQLEGSNEKGDTFSPLKMQQQSRLSTKTNPHNNHQPQPWTWAFHESIDWESGHALNLGCQSAQLDGPKERTPHFHPRERMKGSLPRKPIPTTTYNYQPQP